MAYSRWVRWDRFFDDLEDQLASEWEAERAALDTEAERLRLSRVALHERLGELTGRDAAAAVVVIELSDGTAQRATVTGVGADWVALRPVEGRGVRSSRRSRPSSVSGCRITTCCAARDRRHRARHSPSG
nr:hypothetical protein GCM10025699_20230 [Microbacterium flavescens]